MFGEFKTRFYTIFPFVWPVLVVVLLWRMPRVGCLEPHGADSAGRLPGKWAWISGSS